MIKTILFALRKCNAAALLLATCCTANAGVVYKLTDLGTLGGNWSEANSINDHGVVVGTSMISPLAPNDNHYEAFIWDSANGMRTLGTLGGGLSVANGINNSGHVVGWAYPTGSVNSQAYVWDAIQGMRTLGNESYFAKGINNHGDVSGCASVSGPYGFGHPVVWSPAGTMTDLGTFGGGIGYANSINDSGEVVGFADSAAGHYRAFLWNGQLQDLGSLGGAAASAQAINQLGAIAGHSYNLVGNRRAFIWELGTMYDLGALEQDESEAFGINDLGQVVGKAQRTEYYGRAVLWDQGQTIDLNDVVEPQTAGGWVLESAIDINNLGQIVGRGYLNDEGRAFLLTPKTMPSTRFVSDNFDCAGALADDCWTFINPLNDASNVGQAGGNLLITVDGSNSHTAHVTTNSVPAVLQEVANWDFVIEAKLDLDFDTTAAQITQGILIEESRNRFYRFDASALENDTVLYSAVAAVGAASPEVQKPMLNLFSPTQPLYLRVTRVGELWTAAYSTNGSTWTDFHTFTRVLAVTRVGFFAENEINNGFAARFDYIVDLTPGGADCNSNGELDGRDVANGAFDCNGNGVLDECEGPLDCNANGIDDATDISAGFSDDCNANGIPDECDGGTDCNSNDTLDECELAGNDCNGDLLPDDCQLSSNDCNADNIPDDCQLAGNDCNTNGVLDECDTDCDDNGTPDNCEPNLDCNTNAINDRCELAANDCNDNDIPDACDLTSGTSLDANTNGTADECEECVINSDCNDGDACTTDTCASGTCQFTAIPGCGGGGEYPEECYIEPHDCCASHTSAGCSNAAISACVCASDPFCCSNFWDRTCADEVVALGCGVCDGSDDCNSNGVFDACELDCNSNGAPDDCDLAAGTSADCDANDVPDDCQPDCNTNGIADVCDLRVRTSTDCQPNGIPDECEADLDGDGVIDDCDPDIDDDGVGNAADICNDTPPGTAVSPWGAPKGDIDDDCLPTVADHPYFEICLWMSGPGREPFFSDCYDAFDFDADSDVDLRDFAAMQMVVLSWGS